MKFVSHLFILLMMLASSSLLYSHASSFIDTNPTSLDSLVQPEEEPEFLPVDEAFEFNFEQQGENLIVSWTIAPEYYLYRDKIKFAAIDSAIGDFDFPASVIVEDEYFGKSHVFRQQVSLTVPLEKVGANGEIKVRYQGCADAGLCYPPVKKLMPLIANLSHSSNDKSLTMMSKPTANISNERPISQQNELANKLSNGSLVLTLLAFFGLGLGLAFTPCVFPMYPILSGIIAGRSEKMTTKHGLLLSMTYVQGMALTFAALGLVVASAGVKFQAYFQHPAVLVSLSLLFVILSLSMFGWFELSLPAKWQERLTNISNKQKGGSFSGVFVMGALSGLIASPCTTAPLSGALLYVAQSGDLVLGGITLYILSLGMGLPLLLLGASGGKLLPKSGAWMDKVKTVFGFLLLATPLILLDRIIDIKYTLTAGAILTIALCAYLYTVQQGVTSHKAKTALTFTSLSLFFVAAVTLQQIWFSQNSNQMTLSNDQNQQQDHHGFVDISSLSELRQQLVVAKQMNKPVMIDLYADWCVACKEFEKYTFTDATVKQQMSQFLLLRADVTKNSDTDIALLEHYSIMGLPSLLFFDLNSQELTQQRITGFMDAENFNQHLINILQQ